MDWAAVLNDKSLQDLPYKIELNRFGQIVMSPATNWHGNFQIVIGHRMIRLAKSGKVIAECSVMTSENVKVADVAWASDEFIAKYKMETPYPVAPEVLVEIASPSNTMEELLHKRDLYLAKGAKEVWFCFEDGSLKFFDPSGEIERSNVIKRFPKKIG